MTRSWKMVVLGLCAFLVLAMPIAAKGADEEPATESTTMSIDEMRGMIDVQEKATFVLPRPIVYFALVEQFGADYDFSEAIELNTDWNYESYIKLALNLGGRSADGMAFYASDDMASLKKNADTIEKMMSVLGIEEDVQDSIDALKSALVSGTDDEVKQLADDIYTSVEATLTEQDKLELAQFISLGSWIEGAYIVSASLVENYDAEVSKVVALEPVVGTYITLLEQRKDFVEYEPVLQEIADALDVIAPLVKTEGNDPVPQENIEKLYEIVSGLKTSIEAM